MGAEGSVTLQLREAVEAPDSSGQSDTTSLTIGYPETDLLADIQGSIQATGELWPHAISFIASHSISTKAFIIIEKINEELTTTLARIFSFDT